MVVKEYLKHGKECFEDLDCCESVDDNDDSCPSKLNYYISKEAYLIWYWINNDVGQLCWYRTK